MYAALSFDLSSPSNTHTHTCVFISPSPVTSIPRNTVNFLNLSKTYTLAIAHELQNLDCIVREMRKPASRILTLIRKRTNDLHIVFLRRCCPIIVTRMKFELSSCPAPIRNSTPAHSRFRFLRLVITSPPPLLTVFTTFHVPFSMSSPPSFDARCIQLCTREIPGCCGFNRDF